MKDTNYYYNGNKLLSMLDIRGKKPKIFLCCGNRTAGKTYFFKRWMLRRFVRHGEKFVIFVRFIDDIGNKVDSFFADIGPRDFPGHKMRQEGILHGKAAKLFFDKQHCGYVIPLNDSQRIKDNAALFTDAVRGFFDEFQNEDGKYVSDEVRKFNTIIESIARGGAKGSHTRYFPVYMCSNFVTAFNPYFDYYRISSRLNNHAKFIRGRGWVLEQTYNEQAAHAMLEEFDHISDKELQYAVSNQYLLDNNKFVEDVPGQKRPVFNVDYNGQKYCLWSADKLYYFSGKASDGCGLNLSFTVSDHDTGNTLTPKSSPLVKRLRSAYMQGLVRFANMDCKHVFLDVMVLMQ